MSSTQFSRTAIVSCRLELPVQDEDEEMCEPTMLQCQPSYPHTHTKGSAFHTCVHTTHMQKENKKDTDTDRNGIGEMPLHNDWGKLPRQIKMHKE